MNTAVEGLGVIGLTQHQTPIGRDYVAFNEQEDHDNIISAGNRFDFRTTGMPRAKL